MQHWYHIFPKNTGLSLYIWIIFCVLPFYFIFRSTAILEIGFGIAATLLFFGVYWMSFTSRGPLVYIGISIEFAINIVMSILFGYVYFALFTAFFIGNIKRKAGFITMYVIHLVTTIGAITAGFFLNYSLFLSQIPFLIMTILGVILIPINRYNRFKQEKLEGQLEDANQRIAQLAIIEERHRIARDLHDTLGQKLSMIGLKSELSSKLIEKDREAAIKELQDVQQTARQALKEVREMVSDMRTVRLVDEIEHVKQLLQAANIEVKMEMEADCEHIPLFLENVLSMCLKEAVTNVVKHSQATRCQIKISETNKDIQLFVKDDGVGDLEDINNGNGLKGMKERLEFANGTLEVNSDKQGFTIFITVPKVLMQIEEEGKL
ncbi:sensor histidine kinase [Gracilibacillus massiliensis]|uniref:sensor histidine kinase n=1 Tax=Gracilibacillus massiliensis TaxID=1564956 RepID=UPI00071D4E93|nr:sensor histidine kinase [Gracilibacillus massiliensis]